MKGRWCFRGQSGVWGDARPRKASVAPSDSAASYIKQYFFSLGGGVGGAVGWAVGWAVRAAWPGRTDIPARLTPARPVSLTLTPLAPLLAPPGLDEATLWRWFSELHLVSLRLLRKTLVETRYFELPVCPTYSAVPAPIAANTHIFQHPLLPKPTIPKSHPKAPLLPTPNRPTRH
ncbi:hypothetical protein E2C01_038901 [Portunus trituberculatus]|uniref:Uncharacterized protein n=1 Tax=Portunus trituberculatus TaxID=210409 RepID=A0A5B7FJ72_PORTR|nr:hypothetical protein [Portunus trituberculatus]